MSARLTWSQMREFYKGHWVELIDFEWDWNKPVPTFTRVRHHALDRQELMNKIQSTEQRLDSVVLYVGGSDAVIDLGAHPAYI